MSDVDYSLRGLLEKIAERAAINGQISIASLRRLTGRRMAGPLLFFPAMIVVSPLSLVPTLPTMVAVIVLFVAVQLVAGARFVWLPRRLLDLSLSGDRLEKALKFLRPVASWIDKVSRPRLHFFAEGWFIRIAAAVCIFVALTMPPLEFFPGASTTAGVIIATFGLAITTHDGLLMLIALAFVAAVVIAINVMLF